MLKRMPRSAVVPDRRDGTVRPAAHALDARDPHQPADLVTPDAQACAAGGMPHLPYPVHTLVRPINIHDLVHQICLFQFRRCHRTRQPAIIRLRGDLHAVLGQHCTDRLDPETLPEPMNVEPLYLS